MISMSFLISHSGLYQQVMRYGRGLALGILMAGLTGTTAVAQSSNLSGLNQELQQAVSAQNWNGAISIIDRMMEIAPDQQASLSQYRSRLVTLQSKQQNTAFTTTSGASSPQGFVPIKRRESGVVIIDAVFNGRKNYEMLLDSGASITVITQPMAKSLGIRPEHVVRTSVFSTANGLTEMPIVHLQSVKVGGLVARDVPVAVAGPEMEIGLLGQDFLQRYDVTIKRDSVVFHRRP